jgi:hypothetical protein
VLFSLAAGALSRHLESKSACQRLYSIDKVKVFVVEQESQGGAMRAAAEAVIELFFLAYGKRRGFFLMEGTAGHVLVTPFFQRHIGFDDLNDIGACDQIIDKMLWYAAHGRLEARFQAHDYAPMSNGADSRLHS